MEQLNKRFLWGKAIRSSWRHWFGRLGKEPFLEVLGSLVTVVSTVLGLTLFIIMTPLILSFGVVDRRRSKKYWVWIHGKKHRLPKNHWIRRETLGHFILMRAQQRGSPDVPPPTRE